MPPVSLYIVPLPSLTGSLILAMGYGYDAKGLDDPKVNDARNMVQFASEGTLPGALLVNDFPFCK